MSADDLARSAARAAARVRADLGVGPAEGVCPFDLAAELDVAVRLVALPTLEGMYSPEPKPTIVVSVDRPPGRRRYTCGHELGHHIFGHGTRLDELADEATDQWSPEEFVAQRFAAALMMPKLAVISAFSRREWPISEATPERILVVAQELGVGFATLVGHLERTLRQIPRHAADTLRQVRLPQLRRRLSGFDVPHDVMFVDQHWGRRTVDVEVGDVVILPRDAEFEGVCATLEDRQVRYLVAAQPGIGSLLIDGRRPAVSVRVSRRKFTGIARYRHLEEVADGD